MAPKRTPPRTPPIVVSSFQVEQAARRLVRGNGLADELRATVLRLERPIRAALEAQHPSLGDTAIRAILIQAAASAVSATRATDDPGVAAYRVQNVVHEAVQVAAQKAYRENGLDDYMWITQLDAKVRPMHASLHGTIQKWSRPPVINESGRRGHPGEDYGCRCRVAVPLKSIRAIE